MGLNVKTNLAESRNNRTIGNVLKSRGPSIVYLAVCICFLLSGFAALLYQTAWLRLFSTFFGTSEYAVTIVLASYMGGLALGAWIAGRFLHRIQYPILVYGVLELLIAISALCVPLMMKLAGLAFGAVVGGQAVLPNAGGFLQPAFYVLASMIVIGIPTACMGATLPILMRHIIQTDQQIGRRTGLLYGVNTVGAVFGTLAAAFIFLPALGMRGTVWLGVAINILIYLMAIIIVLTQGFTPEDRALKPHSIGSKKEKNAPVFQSWILPIMLASGLISFVYEVLWTRLLGHVVGGSITAFATMLAAFLTGIAVGGFLGGILAKTKNAAIWWFILAQLMIGLLSAFVYFKIDGLIPNIRAVSTNARMAYTVMLPSTVFIGMTFPLAVRILSQSAEQASTEAARIYTWNTIGAVIGALAAGFLIMPVLGFQGTIVFCVIANLALALCVLFTRLADGQKWIPAALGVVLIIGAGFWRPDRPDAIVKHSILEFSSTNNMTEEFFATGRSATVLSLSTFEFLYFRSNGLPEASVFRKGAHPSILSQQWLGAIPPLLRPKAENMLVVGYGGGAALEAVSQHIQSIDVVELEPEVIKANRATAHLRNYDPLKDPRVNIVLNDARTALQLSKKKFDIIVSQPSHPWTAGASHLFTKEYMKLAKQHLTGEGVFLQWINAEYVSEQLLRDLAATLVSEFKHVRLAQITPNALHFYASDAPLNIEHNLPNAGAVIGGEPNMFANIGINSVNDVLATLVLDEDGTRNFAKTGKLIRDNQNQLANNSWKFKNGLNNRTLMDLLWPYDPFVHSSNLKARDMSSERVLYILDSLVRVGMSNRAWNVMKTLDTEEFRLLAQAAIYKAQGRTSDAVYSAKQARLKNVQDENAIYLSQYAGLSSPDFKVDANDAEEISQDLAILFKSSNAGAEGDWQSVLDQDEALIQIPVTRTYAGQALYLRAKARAELGNSIGDLEKAMALLERSNLIEPTVEKMELRAELADRLQDGPRVLNSIWHIKDQISRGQTNLNSGAQRDPKALQQELTTKITAYENMLDRISDPALLDKKELVKSSLSHSKRKISGGQAMGSPTSH